MTFHQYGTLKYVMNHPVTVENAGELSMVTFGSLIQRGWVARIGNKLELTKEGLEAYELYNKAQANFRKVDTGLTEHVRTMLHISKLIALKNKSA